MGNIWKTSIENLSHLVKKGEFLPSLFNAPDNHWTSDSDKEIALNPDAVSDDSTLYGEWWQDKPRNPEAWRMFISMFSKPISKKDEMTVDSAYDPEFEEIERKELGEDETLNDFSKGMYDPKKHDFPHNTTWDVGPDKAPNQHEPYSPLPVTLDMVQNPENNDQNSPGGFPGRFCQKPKSIWFSNSGEITPALENMLKNKDAAINSLTRDITSAIGLTEKGYWVDPSGKFYSVREKGGWKTHSDWVWENKEMLKTLYSDFPDTQEPYYLCVFLLDKGWVRIGDSFGADYGIEINDPSNIPSSVIDWVSSSGLKAIKIENAGTRKSVLVELPVDDLRETISNEFKRQRLAPMAKIINSLTRDVTSSVHGYGGWINPSGEVLLAEDHGDVILENPDFFGITNPIDKKTIIWSQLYIALYNDGFVRFRVWSDDLWFEINTLDSLRVAEDVIFKLLPDIKKITVNANDGAYKASVEEFKEKGFDAFSKQVPVMAKQASIEDVNGVKVLVKPSWNELANSSRKLRGGHMFRGLIDPHTGDLFVWDAYTYIHQDMIAALGLDIEYSEESPYCLYFPPSSIYDALERQQEVKQGKLLRVGSVDISHTKDWLLRHKTPMDAEGRAILYHGTPKANAEVLCANGLRQWSLLAQTPEEAIHYAGRDRDLKPKNITVFEVHVPVDKLNGGVFASVAEALGPEYLREIKIGKTAGSYSSTYTDEQGEQFFNEQHHDNVDEEPYVDHSERDYDGGYWDAATNTGQNTPWAKDITPSVCLLDQLQNPADRNFPPGMMDYETIIFETYPMSDGLEKGNPE
jgi:hypothetical protein